jgi:hypothetical protein
MLPVQFSTGMWRRGNRKVANGSFHPSREEPGWIIDKIGPVGKASHGGGRDAERTPHNKADKGQFDRTRWVEQRLLADKGGKIKVLGEERGLFSTSAVCFGVLAGS